MMSQDTLTFVNTAHPDCLYCHRSELAHPLDPQKYFLFLKNFLKFFLKILYSGIFSNSTANDSVHLQYFSFPATTFSLEGLFTKMVGVKPQRRVFAFRSKRSRYDRTRNKSWWSPWRVCLILDKSKETRTLRIGKFFLPGLAISIITHFMYIVPEARDFLFLGYGTKL